MASTLGALNRHAFLNVAVVTMAIQADIQLVTDLYGGSVADTALFLSTTSGFVGLTEFLLNPTIGRLSDRFGRRFFLLIGCTYCTFGNAMVGLLSPSLPLIAVNRVLSWSLLTISGSVVGSAAISDCSDAGVDLSINLGSYFSSFGLGVIVGPAIGGWVLTRTGSPQAAYLARSATALFEVLHDLVFLPETLGLRERLQNLPAPKAPSVSIVSPLSFIRLFSGPETMVKLCIATFLVCWAEGKNTNDLFQLWMKQNVGLTIASANIMTIVYGVFMFCGGRVFAPFIIRRCGPRTFTTLSIATQTLGLGLWGVVASVPSLIGGLLLQFISVNVSQATALDYGHFFSTVCHKHMTTDDECVQATSKTCLHAAATDHAVAYGMGRGEFQGMFNNMRAIAVAIAPIVYGRAYAALTKRGRYPGQVWLLIAVVAGLVPELIHRSISAGRYTPQ